MQTNACLHSITCTRHRQVPGGDDAMRPLRCSSDHPSPPPPFHFFFFSSLQKDSLAMLPRRYRFTTSALLVLSLLTGDSQVYAQSEFDCRISLDGGKRKYDLTSLAGEHTLSRTRDTPPSQIVDELRFNLCGDLELKQGVEDQDQVRNERLADFLSFANVLWLVSVWHSSLPYDDEPEELTK